MLSAILGTADTFAVLAGSTVTNSGSTILNGDLGVWPGTAITGFPPGIVVAPGQIHATDAVAQQAEADATTAYNTLAALPATQTLTGQDLGGLTLTPGVYTFASSAQLTGTLTLDVQNDPNAMFVFQIGSSLTTASASKVQLINARPCFDNIYWQVGSSATLGSTTEFNGAIIAQASVWMDTGATITKGHALALTGEVTLLGNTISTDLCGSISGVKWNDLNGDGAQDVGEPGLSGWSIEVYKDDGDSIFEPGTGDPLTTTATTTSPDGAYTTTSLLAGTYFVRETPQANWFQTSSPTVYTVTLTAANLDATGISFGNQAAVPGLGISKTFVNVTGGNGNGVADFAGDLLNYTVEVTNTGNITLTGVTVVDPLTGQNVSDVTLAPGASQSYNTSYTLTQADLNNQGSGDGDIDNLATADSNETDSQIASATVLLVYAPALTIDKVADQTTVSTAGQVINYTITVQSTGNVDVTNVVVTDPFAGGATLTSGDDGDNVLETTETWIYTASHTVTQAEIDAGSDLVNVAFMDTGETTPQRDDAITTISAQPGIDIEKTTNGPTNTNPTLSDYDNEDAANGLGVPILTSGSTVVWTYKVTNTGGVPFAQAEVVVTDDNGTPGNTLDDLSTTNATITFQSVLLGDADSVLEPGEVWVYQASGVVQTLVGSPLAPVTLKMKGNTSADGPDGNIRTFSSGSVSVNVSGFSREKANPTWQAAWLGAYVGGVGVTDPSEDGSNDSHTIDNISRDNYVLFEFNQPVIVDSTFLGYVTGDSDMNVWIGTISNAFNNHITLSDAVLASLGFTEVNDTTSSGLRTADINAGKVVGNVMVVSARRGGDSKADRFKINTLRVAPSPGIYENKATVTAGGEEDSDLSHYRNSTESQSGLLGPGMTGAISFWQNSDGQALIKSLNGSSTAKKLGNWLASKLPGLFGSGAGTGNNLSGKTNLQVAAYFQQVFAVSGTKLQAQSLAAALAVYVTNSTLAGGTYAVPYGFKVSTTGTTSAALYNVGVDGVNAGLITNKFYSVFTLLQQASTKNILAGSSAMITAWNSIFSGINETGDIL